VKFNSGGYIADKTENLPPRTTVVVLDIVTAWVKWQNGKPIEHRITYPGQVQPDRDDLGDRDEALWELGLNGELTDCWKDTRYVRLVDPQSGADFTFVTDTFGGRMAVGELKSQVSNVRYAHPVALPIVQLGTTQMKTDYGPKPRPQFKVVGCRNKDDTTSVAPATRPAITDQREPTSYDDEIPILTVATNTKAPTSAGASQTSSTSQAFQTALTSFRLPCFRRHRHGAASTNPA
jgi:hypothetical protein